MNGIALKLRGAGLVLAIPCDGENFIALMVVAGVMLDVIPNIAGNIGTARSHAAGKYGEWSSFHLTCFFCVVGCCGVAEKVKHSLGSSTYSHRLDGVAAVVFFTVAPSAPIPPACHHSGSRTKGCFLPLRISLACPPPHHHALQKKVARIVPSSMLSRCNSPASVLVLALAVAVAVGGGFPVGRRWLLQNHHGGAGSSGVRMSSRHRCHHRYSAFFFLLI
ncbi:hypothetical protein TcBrA4_0110250 [Trypanosoma cruzi]|nr:hypothetical protein TcBrA4_0110250 [Trypanosoma cruzi]